MVVVAATLELVYRAFDKEPPISRRTLRFFSANTAFDIGRARRLLGFEPVFDIASGLADTLRIIGGRRGSSARQGSKLCESRH